MRVIGSELALLFLALAVVANAAAEKRRDDCSCLGYKYSHTQRGVILGDGREHIQIANQGFYDDLESNYCLRTNTECWDNQWHYAYTPNTTWCFTERGCAENEENISHTDPMVGWKMCSGHDANFSDLTPTQMVD